MRKQATSAYLLLLRRKITINHHFIPYVNTFNDDTSASAVSDLLWAIGEQCAYFVPLRRDFIIIYHHLSLYDMPQILLGTHLIWQIINSPPLFFFRCRRPSPKICEVTLKPGSNRTHKETFTTYLLLPSISDLYEFSRLFSPHFLIVAAYSFSGAVQLYCCCDK